MWTRSMTGMIVISNFFLCHYCANQHTKGNQYEWTEMCDAGEIEPKVMYDHHGVGGKRYDEPTDVCDHYEQKGKS